MGCKNGKIKCQILEFIQKFFFHLTHAVIPISASNVLMKMNNIFLINPITLDDYDDDDVDKGAWSECQVNV